MVALFEEVTAEFEGKLAFEDAGGSVKQPFEEFDADVSETVLDGESEGELGLALDGVDEPAVDEGVDGEGEVGGEEEGVDEEVAGAGVAGVAPGGAEEGDIGGSHVQPAGSTYRIARNDTYSCWEW